MRLIYSLGLLLLLMLLFFLEFVISIATADRHLCIMRCVILLFRFANEEKIVLQINPVCSVGCLVCTPPIARENGRERERKRMFVNV